MSLHGAILAQAKEYADSLLAAVTGGLEHRVDELEARVTRLENAAKTAPARAAAAARTAPTAKAQAGTAEAKGKAHP
jgi:hypothetical protein